jgi:hypothetical protein
VGRGYILSHFWLAKEGKSRGKKEIAAGLQKYLLPSKLLGFFCVYFYTCMLQINVFF